MRFLLFLFLCLGLAISRVAASQEGTDPFLRFRIEAGPNAGRGPIIVSGQRSNEGGLEELTVKFLDNEIQVQREILLQIPRWFNGIQISSEPGIMGPPGYTVYLVFTEGWVSSPELRSRFAIGISEAHGTRVIPPR